MNDGSEDEKKLEAVLALFDAWLVEMEHVSGFSQNTIIALIENERFANAGAYH